MARLPVAVARIRAAVRPRLAELAQRSTVLVACSGGPDSMALAATVVFLAPRMKLRCGLITVDHRLQEGSRRRAGGVVDWAHQAGFDPAEVATVTVDRAHGGPEAAARTARYAALAQARRRYGAETVLLGHTLDDQAETVLLALARGSGPRGIAAMPARRDGLCRPLLEVTRADTVQCCADLGLATWDDPHNTDPAYTRSRLRAAMPLLTEALGERLVANLARTAELVAEDTTALDEYARRLLHTATVPGGAADSLPRIKIGPLAEAPRAVRTRALRGWALTCGADAGELGYVHIAAMESLVARWHGQGPLDLPGGIHVRREHGLLVAGEGRPA
jgi:tRNA(Ile)-lysidine synthase